MKTTRAKNIIDKLGMTDAEFSRMIGKHAGYTYNWERSKVPKSMALALLALERLSDEIPRTEILDILNSKELKDD